MPENNNSFNELNKDITQLLQRIYKSSYPIKTRKLIDLLTDKLSANISNHEETLLSILSSVVGTSTLKDILEEQGKSIQTIEPDRLQRYNEFELLFSNVPALGAAHRVYLDNILYANALDNEILQVTADIPSTIGEKLPNLTDAINNVKQIIQSLDLTSVLYRPVSDMLLYGDGFLEIIDYSALRKNLEYLSSSSAPTSKEQSSEQQLLESLALEEASYTYITVDIPKDKLKNIPVNYKRIKLLPGERAVEEVDLSKKYNLYMLDESVQIVLQAEDNTTEKELLEEAKKFALKSSTPKLSETIIDSKPASDNKTVYAVINVKTGKEVLQENMSLWNLETTEIAYISQLGDTPGNAEDLPPIATQLGSLKSDSKKNTDNKLAVGGIVNPADLQEKDTDEVYPLSDFKLVYHNPKNVIFVNKGNVILGAFIIYANGDANIVYNSAAVQKILVSFINSLQDNKQLLKQILEVIEESPEVKQQILDLLNNLALQGQGNNKLRIKFVPIDRLIHFRSPISKYEPYGESIFEPVKTYASYLYVSLKAMIIYKLTRAIEKRIFYVESGLDRDTEAIVQEVREALTKQKYVVADGSLDALTDVVAMFDDIWLPMRQGQELVRVDVIASPNTSVQLDDIQWFTQNIYDILSIPPTYLALERGEERKYFLSEMNARFAAAIAKYKRVVELQIAKIIRYVYTRVYKDAYGLQHVKVKLNPLIPIQIEKLAEMLDNVSRLASALESIGMNVNKQELIKTLIPYIDWQLFLPKDLQIADKIKNIEKSSKKGGTEEAGGEEFGGEFNF